MKIGLTYDLKDDYLGTGLSNEAIAEFDKPETIDAIETALFELGYSTERIGNAKQLVRQISKGNKWDAVFNICEGLNGISREAQVPAILELYEIPYVFSDPLVLSLTLHKGLTKHVIRDAGIATADFAIIEDPKDCKNIALHFPLFVKPVAEGTGKGISSKSIINNHNELYISCKIITENFMQAALVETFLPGREFTAGITGTGEKAQCIGIMECIFNENPENNAYSYENKANYHLQMQYSIPEKEVCENIRDIALKAWKVLGCRDGGRIDIRMDKNGIPNFIEVNPLAGLHPVDSDLIIIANKYNISYKELIKMIMDSAFERINKQK